jgi:hypothetical protein
MPRSKNQRIGEANLLVEVNELAENFECTPRTAIMILTALRIPIVHAPNKKRYFNFHTFEKVLFYLTRCGGQGFAMSGSEFRRHFRQGVDKVTLIEMTDEDMKAMEDPVFVAEFECAGTRRAKAGVVSAYVRELAERKKKEDAKHNNKG